MAKKIVQDFNEGKSVPTQELVESLELEEGHSEPKVLSFVATSPFELKRGYKTVEYKIGDMFPVPEDWTRDTAFEEFRKVNKNSNGTLNGVTFSVPLPVLDEKGNLKYMDSRRVILPLREA